MVMVCLYKISRMLRAMLSALVLFSAVTACGANRRVQRVSAGTTGDISGNWNDTDARLTSEALAGSCLKAGWLSSFVEEEGRKPAVRIRGVVNKTDEHIDAQVFIKNIEKALVNSGRVKVLAQAGQEMSAVASEQDLGASGVLSDDSSPSIGNETGADFVIAVRLASILDQADGDKVKLYKINFELLHSSSGEKVWIGDHEIKKIITQASVAW